MDDTTKLPKRVRPPKTDAQKRAAAAASARNREKNRVAGIPSPAAIDTTIAIIFLRQMYSKRGLSVNEDGAEALILALATHGGWEIKNDAVRKAIEHRIAALRVRTRPSSSTPAGDGPQE